MRRGQKVRCGPLRKVVRDWTKIEIIESPYGGTREWPRHMETLECGHEQTVRKDCFGEYYTEKRRCPKCKPPIKGE